MSSLLDEKLFSKEELPELESQRVQLFPAVWDEVSKLKGKLYWEKLPEEAIKVYAFPIAQFILKLYKGKPLIICLGGGSGAGKTTLSFIIRTIINKISNDTLGVIALSYDDFFLTKEERIKRGFKWRNEPGAHNTKLAIEVLSKIKSGDIPITIPRFNKLIDDMGEPETINKRVDICILETLYDSSHCPDDGKVNDFLDFFIYLDQDPSILKKNRFGRERRMNKISGGGFTPEEMEKFWNESINTVNENYFVPTKTQADMVIKLDENILPKEVILR